MTPRGRGGLRARARGRRAVGLLLTREGDEWQSGLCSQVDPSDFLALTDVEDNSLPPFNWGGIVVGFARARCRALFFLVRKARS